MRRIISYVVLASAFSVVLTSCYAQEMHLEDPLYNYQEERVKTLLFAPLTSSEASDLSIASFGKQLEQSWQKGFSALTAVRVVTDPRLLKQWASQFQILGQESVTLTGLEAKVDLVATSQYRLTYHRGAAAENAPLSAKELLMLAHEAQKQGVYLELDWRVQFWDTRTQRLIFEHHDVVGDMALVQDRAQLEQLLAEQAVRNLLYRLKPYFVYR